MLNISVPLHRIRMIRRLKVKELTFKSNFNNSHIDPLEMKGLYTEYT